MSKIWGIRYDDRDFNIGDEITPSHKYDLGVDTGEELSGTSAIMVSDESDFLEYLDGELEADCGELDRYNEALNASYNGTHVYLVMIDSSWGVRRGRARDCYVRPGGRAQDKIGGLRK